MFGCVICDAVFTCIIRTALVTDVTYMYVLAVCYNDIPYESYTYENVWPLRQRKYDWLNTALLLVR